MHPAAPALLLTVALGFGAAGCGTPTPPSATPASAPAEVDPETIAKVGFRDGVLAIVRQEFPDLELETSVDPEILRHAEAELGLQNLRAKCRSLAAPETAGAAAAAIDVEICRGVIRQHFAALRERLEKPAPAKPLELAEASPRLRPQLAPAEYLEKNQLAHRTFGDGLVVAFVLDSASNYSYVTEDDLARWKVDVAEVERRALANLAAASRDIPVQATEPPDLMLAVEVGDGYDATRLLLPDFRRFAAAKLGESFYAAIPNRDVLVMWSKASSPEFQARLRAHIGSQFRGEPYALTDRIFEVGPGGLTALPK
jgi:hypothetical protein